MTTDPFIVAVSDALGAAVDTRARLSGGDVAESFRLDLADGTTVFAKTHSSAPPGFFTTEATGLEWLRSAGTVEVPEVLAVSDGDPDADVPNFLVLGWIEESGRAAADEAAFGRSLAGLHRWTGWADLCGGALLFGRPDGRTTGSRGLPNEPSPSWAEFYGGQRLLPLARLAHAGGALDPQAVAALERLAGRLDRLGVPDEPAALLHGDLWAGNRLVDVRGRSWLVDPAAHGGHREFDLAMMRLFGGFGSGCFAAYDEEWPLGSGWEERVALHQVAPLVVHAIKFGGPYVAAATQAIDRYA